jgi:hypothetical protein
MEMSQQNTLYTYLKQKCLFSSKTESRKVKQALSGGLVAVGSREDIRKGCRRVNVVKILCTHV